MKKCRNCSAEMEDRANYCPDCGAAQYGDQIYDDGDRYQRPTYSDVPRDDSPRRRRIPPSLLLCIIGITASFVTTGLVGIVLGTIAWNLDPDRTYKKYCLCSIFVGIFMLILATVFSFLYMQYFSAYFEEVFSSMGM
ncbi:MAG: zinc ribbon domain-containing protein [Bacilli bacterium]|nr:zinc ribbon domain-containing protein [Bacilli bacterium]